MSFRIERNDIINVCADAIVNTANPQPTIGSGTDKAVYTAAGPKLLFDARKKIKEIEPGTAKSTKSFYLRNKTGVKFIIHTVGTGWIDGKHGEIDILRQCYRSCLQLAESLECRSVAIPLLATGNLGFPKELALDLAIEEIRSFILEHEIDVILVVYDKQSFKVSIEAEKNINSFIDETYIATKNEEDKNSDVYEIVSKRTNISISPFGIISPEDWLDLNDFIAKSRSHQNFYSLLRYLMDKKGIEKDSTLYKKSIIVTKYTFHRIRSENHIPTKHSVMALGLALELDLPTFELFLATADYVLNPFDLFDTVVKYCITKHIYDVMKIDAILFQMNLPCFQNS